MTKIVYNACFGGFGLSHKAIMRYGELANLNLLYVPGEHSVAWDNRYYKDGIQDDEHYFSDRDISRTDPFLAQVVEELGNEANDSYSELAIRELEPGTKYRIDEYDGSERVITVDEYHWEIA
jgi:hypothetical protein